MDVNRTLKSAFLLSMAAAVIIVPAVLTGLVGCTNGGFPNRGNGNGDVPPAMNDNGAPEFGILNFRSNSASSEDVVLTVIYSVPSTSLSVVGFVQLLNAPANSGGTAIGAEEIVATALPAGLEQTFLLDTTDLRPGFYQIGVRADGLTFLSTGTMEIQGPPAPLFLEPASDVTFEGGEFVDILADVGDPQGVANWRLFFQDADDPQLEEGQAAGGRLLGQRITEGTGNTVDVRWDTRNVESGTYRLGLSATDIGMTVAGAVQADRADTVVTTYSDAVVTLQPPPDAARPPTIDLLTPDQTAFGGDAVDIDFSADVFEGDDFVVTLFSLFNDAETVFATVTDPSVTTVTFATESLTSGVYEIGARISDGFNDVVEVPPVGRVLINVVRAEDASLTVSAPGESVRIAQGDSVDIEWTTNVPPDRGTIDVFARRFVVTDPLGDATNEVSILSGVSTSVTRATWTTTNERALYIVLVRLTVTDPPLPDAIVAVAPGTVRVSLTAAQFWLGQIGGGIASSRQGEIFQGVNFQDNAGTFVTTVGDLDADGKEDYIVGARFGKPFFQNPDGIGIGEAYLIYGDERHNATQNLNKVALTELRGIAFTGVQPRDDAAVQTDGLSAIRLIPDQDGDRLPELAFGIPFVQSRGHTRRLYVDRSPFSTSTLERSDQFTRGGVVFVASTNTKLTNPEFTFTNDPDAPIEFRAVINLDLCGQNFTLTGPGSWETIEGGVNGCADLIVSDTVNADEDTDAAGNPIVTCTQNETDGDPETFVGTQRGFSPALADHLGVQCTPFSNAAFDPPACYEFGIHLVSMIPNPVGGCAATLGYTFGAIDGMSEIGLTGPSPLEDPSDTRLGTGFYPITGNNVLEPFGARLIGNESSDKFGSSITVSGDFLIISAPERDPVVSVEVPGFTGPAPTDPGVMYLINMNNLWPDDSLWGVVQPPLPFQYQIGPFPEGAPIVRNSPSHCGRSALLESFPSPFRILGESGQRIQVVEGVSDFNGDLRGDFVVGAPLADGGDGAVNIVYRRDPFLEGDYILARLGEDPLDPERLAGLRINGRPGEGFGEVIATSHQVINDDGSLTNEGADFNGDGLDDVILGNPNADGGRGEIVVVFATSDLISPANGYDIDTLLTLSDSAGRPRAVRIVGRETGDQFGFNVAVLGDFNGDGANDLLVAAPGASPMFDSDDDGTLDTPGIDVVNLSDPDSPFGDGAPDDIPGTADDLLTNAGEVYLILGAAGSSNNLALLADGTRTVSIATLGTNAFRGAVFVGRQESDALGGGNEIKRGKRSFGIGSAGDVDGDGRADILLGSILADPQGRTDAGEAYLVYGFGL